MDSELRRGELPPAPKGVDPEKWLNSLLALKAEGGMPNSELQRLRTLRQVNLYTWMVIILKNPWKMTRAREHELIDPDFKIPDGSR